LQHWGVISNSKFKIPTTPVKENTMDTNKHDDIVTAFFQVVKDKQYVFDAESRQNLSTLERTLAEVDNQPLDRAADAIMEWCQDYQPVLEAVVFNEREIQRMGKPKPSNQETIFKNKFPTWQDDLKTLQNQPPADGEPQNQPPTDSDRT
jgi:hypothetical protein